MLSLAYRTNLALIGLVDLDLLYLVSPIFFYLVAQFGSPIWRSLTANLYRAGWEVWIPKKVMNRVVDEIEHKTARANKRFEEKNKYLNDVGEKHK